MQPPAAPPTGPPDLASPGYQCYVFIDGTYQRGFIQTAIDNSDGHVPKPPDKGLPGTWVAVVLAAGGGAAYAWLPTADTTTPPPDSGTPPVDPDAPHPEPVRSKKH